MVKNPLFKIFSKIFIVSWVMHDDENRVTVSSESKAKELFASLKSKYETSLIACYADGTTEKLA